MATTFTPNIENVLRQNNNFSVPLSSSPHQALGTWEKEGGLQSIYDEYAKATNIAGDWADKTYNPTNPYKTEGLLGDVRHVVGSSMAKDQLQNLLGDYVKPGSPLAEKLTYGLGMFKTYAEELDDAIRIGKDTIKAGDWDKIWSGKFLTHPAEDIRLNRIGLSIPYGSTEWERLSNVPGIKNDPRFRFKQQQLMNRRKQDMQQKIRQAEAIEAAKQKVTTGGPPSITQKKNVITTGGPPSVISRPKPKPYVSPARPHGNGGGGGGSGAVSTGAGRNPWGRADGGLINFYRYGGFI